MDMFRPDGHLTDEALRALADNEPLDELDRLETAEHLAFCDYCLQRYTDALAETELLIPQRSCRRTVWLRIRSRAVRLVTSRYATAAAAVALALTMLWGGGGAERVQAPPLPEDRPSVSQRLSGLTGELGNSLSETMFGLSDFFDGLRPSRFMQGGGNS